MHHPRLLFLTCIALALSGCQLLPGGGGAAQDTQPRRMPPTIDRSGTVAPSLVDQQCLAHLGATGARFSPLVNSSEAPGCSQINAVSLTDLQGDMQN